MTKLLLRLTLASTVTLTAACGNDSSTASRVDAGLDATSELPPHRDGSTPAHDASSRHDARADAREDAGADAPSPHDASTDTPARYDAGRDATPPRDAGIDSSFETAPCFTTFHFQPPAGTSPGSISVTGEWNNFALPGTPMTGPDANGAYTAEVQLAPGLVAYQLVVDGTSQLDPAEHWQKYVGGSPRSAVPVTDCHAPTLTLVTNAVARPASGQGAYTATVAFHAGVGAPALSPASVTATLRKDGVSTSVSGVTPNATQSTIALDVPGLADGKYTLFVSAKDEAGQNTQMLRLVFWVEADVFSWADAVTYMAMTDRFKNGDLTNDPPPTTVGSNNATVSVDPRVDYHGGDFAGLAQEVSDGTLDGLGVRTLWLSPFYTSPSDAWLDGDGVHYRTGYDGAWPIKAREVDARWGGAAALTTLVTAAHAHGIRVLMDLAVQQVHQEHEYVAAHPDWFNTTGCICGTSDCDPTVHRLDCLTASYLPGLDWTSASGAAQWEADAVYWLDAFDLDGLRLGGLLKVPDLAVINLSSAVRDEFEPSGTKLYLLGETDVGWVDDSVADNAPQYQLVNEYLRDGLDGQLDSVLFYAVPANVFANQSYGLGHADFWTETSVSQYRPSALMSPFIGTEDMARFITIASYRGQTPALDPSIPYNEWTNVAGPPPDSETYGRQRLALAWLLGQPGVPMLYYGDEYGEYGSVDPNNRVDWRGGSANLSADEQATLTFTQKLGTARRNLVAMRRGAYVSVYNTDASVLVFARQSPEGDVALVTLSRLDTPTQVTTALLPSLNLASGLVLHDQMGGPDVTVTGSTVTVSLGAQGVAILAP